MIFFLVIKLRSLSHKWRNDFLEQKKRTKVGLVERGPVLLAVTLVVSFVEQDIHEFEEGKLGRM